MIRKAIITTAGWATRLLPVSKSIPKSLLPLGDKPIIHYLLKEAVESGIQSIVLVTNNNSDALEDYFTNNAELTMILQQKNNNKVLSALSFAESIDIKIVHQSTPLGLGHAVLLARDFIGHEPFCLFLSDDLFYTGDKPPCARQLIDIHEDKGGSVLSIMPVAHSDISRYGIVTGEQIAPNLLRVSGLVEKPHPKEAPSNLAVIGRYVLTPEIFDALENVKPGVGNEIQLTDALALLLQHQPTYACFCDGIRHDAGAIIPWIISSIAYSLRDPDIAPHVKEYLRGVDLS
jgi:UTP--glucose-1-phosphate uridylyltransferase